MDNLRKSKNRPKENENCTKKKSLTAWNVCLRGFNIRVKYYSKNNTEKILGVMKELIGKIGNTESSL